MFGIGKRPLSGRAAWYQRRGAISVRSYAHEVDGPAATDVRDEAAGFPSRRLAWSTAVFSAFTGLSRILGLVREIVARSYFGVEGVGINAFTVAFQIPNLVRTLVADAAISSAFVPVFSELLER